MSKIIGITVGTTYDKNKISGGGLTDEQLTQLETLIKWYEQEHYTTMTVSISPSGKTYEIGSKQTITISWKFSQEVSSVTLNGEAQAAESEGSKTVTVAGDVASNTSFTYTVTGIRKDGNKESKSASCTFLFQNKFYRGYAADPRSSGGVVDSSFIRSLQHSGFASGRACSFTQKANSGTYIWYAYPKRFGVATAYMAPPGSSYMKGGFEAPETVSVTNSSGYTEDYYFYRSINTGLNQDIKMT